MSKEIEFSALEKAYLSEQIAKEHKLNIKKFSPQDLATVIFTNLNSLNDDDEKTKTAIIVKCLSVFYLDPKEVSITLPFSFIQYLNALVFPAKLDSKPPSMGETHKKKLAVQKTPETNIIKVTASFINFLFFKSAEWRRSFFYDALTKETISSASRKTGHSLNPVSTGIVLYPPGFFILGLLQFVAIDTIDPTKNLSTFLSTFMAETGLDLNERALVAGEVTFDGFRILDLIAECAQESHKKDLEAIRSNLTSFISVKKSKTEELSLTALSLKEDQKSGGVVSAGLLNLVPLLNTARDLVKTEIEFDEEITEINQMFKKTGSLNLEQVEQLQKAITAMKKSKESKQGQAFTSNSIFTSIKQKVFGTRTDYNQLP